MIAKASKDKSLSKSAFARQQGISRSSLYYQPVKPQQDWYLKNQIEQILHQYPSYGHRRIALELRINKKKIKRVMNLFGLKPYRRRGRKFRKTKDLSPVYANLLQQAPLPERPEAIWASDFTPIPFHGRFVYLATIVDLFNRKIVGWNLLTTHNAQLTLTALINAVEKYGRPKILHSDQGSEYKSKTYTKFARDLGIHLSMSHKGSPWENGFQEAFFSQFKVDLGDPNRFRTLGELAAAVYLQIHYYNNLRIHTKLKMPPAMFAERHQKLTINLSPVIL